MAKTIQINIKDHLKNLGPNFYLVSIIWEEICNTGFTLKPFEPLLDHEIPEDECYEIEKILLACIAYTEHEEERVFLSKTLLLNIYNNHRINPETNFIIKGPFFIVLV